MISTTVSRISKSRGEGILFTLMIEKTYDSAFSIPRFLKNRQNKRWGRDNSLPLLYKFFSLEPSASEE